MTLLALMARITALLDDAAIPYMLTGSLASSFYGMPRSTQDVDLVIEVTADQLTGFCAALAEADFYVSIEAAQEASEHEGQFNAIDREDGWKVDFIIRRSRAFSQEEFRRRRFVSILGRRLPVTSPEDLILAKLEWAEKGDSELQRRDVQAILRSQGANLDQAYIERWAGELGVLDSWKEHSGDIEL